MERERELGEITKIKTHAGMNYSGWNTDCCGARHYGGINLDLNKCHKRLTHELLQELVGNYHTNQ